MIARLAVAAALAGSAAGAAVVLADEPAPSRPVVPAIKTVVPPARPTPEPIEARNPRLVLETPDPKGATPWAVRRFETTFTDRKGKRTPATCYELGRLRDKSFGWIGADGTFAATQPGRGLHPVGCPSAKTLDANEATVMRFATVTTPPGGSPQPDRAVTWGFARPQVVQIRFPGEPPIPAHGGLYVHIGTDKMPAPPTQRTLVRADGTRRHIDELAQSGRRGERPTATRTLAAVAPDPGGGRPWGLILARGERGSTCLSSPEQLVGDAYAYLDPQTGVAYSGGIGGFFNCTRKPPTRAFPMRIDTLISSIPATDGRGRVERRAEEGRIVFSGLVHPDVVSVTITTPHDVRTLVPTPRRHAIVAVYAGRFPGGEATATARFKDGRRVTRSLYVE